MSALLILLILTVLFVGLKLRQSRRNCLPGPFPWPLIGNVLYVRKLIKELGAQYLAFEYLSKKYKSNVIGLQLGTNVVVINDSKLVHILQKDEFNARPWNTLINVRNPGVKRGLFTNDGSEHKELRAWSLRTMRNIGYGKRTMVDFLLNELQIILDKLEKGNVRYMKPVIALATLNTLWLFIGGKHFFVSDKRVQSILHLIECRAKVFDVVKGLVLSVPLIRYTAPNTTRYNILLDLNLKEQVTDVVMDFIKIHKERYQKGSETDFIDWFLREMSERDKDEHSAFNDNNLRIILVDFFLAGTSTTTPVLEFLFLEMANHQDAQRKLHEEIDRVIGPDRFPDMTDRSKMNYTEAVINECIRKWIIFPVLPRETVEDTIVEGYKIPRGTTVLFNMASLNHDATLFPDPMSFKPERFLKDGIFEVNENLMLFGKGKRRCPGEILARSALFFFFVGVMQKYRVLPPNNEESIKIEVNIGLAVDPKPYELLIVPR